MKAKNKNETLTLETLKRLVSDFPGLSDGETEVNGADLVDALTEAVENLKRKGVKL
jgi:hypothetical protein